MEKHAFLLPVFLGVFISSMSHAQSEPNKVTLSRKPVFTPSTFIDTSVWLTSPGLASVLTDPNKLSASEEAMFATYSFSHNGVTYNVEFYYRELYQRLRARVLVGDRELQGLFNRFYGVDPKDRYMVSVSGREDGNPTLQLNIGRLSLRESDINTDVIYDAVETFVAKSQPRKDSPWIRVSPPSGMLKKMCRASMDGYYLVNEKGQVGPFTLENLLIAYYQEGIKAKKYEDFEKIGHSLMEAHGESMGLRYVVVSDVNEVHKYGVGLPVSFDAAEIKPPTTYKDGNSQLHYWTCYACARYKMGPSILACYKFGFQNGLIHSGERTVLTENERGAYIGYPNLPNMKAQEKVILGWNSDSKDGDPNSIAMKAISLVPKKTIDRNPLLSLAVLRSVFVGAGMALLALAYLVRRKLRRDKAKFVMRMIQFICLFGISVSLIVGYKKKPPKDIERQNQSHKSTQKEKQLTIEIASLHDAARVGDVHRVEKLIAQGVYVNARQENGYTPLHYAASWGHMKVAELLINNGADVNAGEDQSSGTPLHCAAANAHTEVINLLLKKGAHINANNDRLRGTPVHVALNRGHNDIVRLLVAKGADINARNIQHHQFTGTTTPLHKGVKSNDIKQVQELTSGGADVNAKDRYGYTPLHYAALEGYENIAELLINNGADVNAATWLGDTPLHLAVERHHADIAELLILKGADVNAKGNYGRTPLHHAARLGNKSLTELLLAKGADVNASDENRHSPLSGAAQQGYTEIAEVLISYGADVKWENHVAYPPLYWAVERNQKKVAELLIANGAVVNAKYRWGETLLHNAAMYGARDTAEVLLDNGADINAKDERGNTPLRNAIFWNHEDLAAFLISKGADTNAKIETGQTPLDLAREKNYYDVVRLLTAPDTPSPGEGKTENSAKK